MRRVTVALILSEIMERTHDRWVLVISSLFTLLATGVSYYGRAAGEEAANLTGPSLVTLTSLFVPLVALVLGHDAIVGERERNTLGLLLSLPFSKAELIFAKYSGRLVALLGAIVIGLGVAFLLQPTPQNASFLWRLIIQTIFLGASFLSIGVLISTLVKRQTAAASLVVCIWFLFVFFYDLGLLGLLIATDGAIPTEWISRLVLINPSGLFRVQMMAPFLGENTFSELGLSIQALAQGLALSLWALWVLLPLAISGLIFYRRKVV